VGQLASLADERSGLGQIARADNDVVAAFAQLDMDGQRIVQGGGLLGGKGAKH
jgi:hypothetical protein